MTVAAFRPPPAAEAGWLVCRQWQRADAGALLEAVRASAEHLRPWMPWSVGYDLATAEGKR